VIDDYPSCEETYVTLRLYHDSADPVSVSSALGLSPTDSQRIGESYQKRGVTQIYPFSGWFYCSERHVQSYDTAKHLDWLLRQLKPRQAEIDQLRAQGWRMDIACLWDSRSGHGGPALSPDLLRRLAALGIELWFDVYFHGAYEGVRQAKQINATHPGA
jgi:hypothetical protein